MQCPSGASQFVMPFIALLQLTSGFCACAFMFGIKNEMDSQKSTVTAAVNWLACYPAFASVLVKVFVQRIACLRSMQSHKQPDDKNKYTRQALRVFNIAANRPPSSGFVCTSSAGLATASDTASANRSVALHYLQPLLLTPAQGCFTLCFA